MQVTLGCDPELFVVHPEKGFVNGAGLIPGTKENPYRVDKGAVQVDGMALEFNIDPANSENEWERNITTVISQLTEMVKEKDKDLRLEFTSVAHFDPLYFIQQPLENKILGCDPDFDEFGQMKVPDDELMFSPIRTAAGHMHVGWTKDKDPLDPEHFGTCLKVAQAFKDYPLFTPQNDTDKERLKYYGASCSLRPKSYGVELRSPSNYWVRSEGTRRRMYRQVVRKMGEF